ncbi:MAG: VTT domain-containing protein [Candidatus Pacearchaeota archaeon]
MKTKILKDIIAGVIAIIILFAIISFIVEKNIAFLKEIIQANYLLGAIFFIFIEALAIVFAPFSSTPLTPIASKTFGVLITSSLFYTGNIIGSILAFLIAKKYGKKAVSKIINIKKAEELAENLSSKNIFISLVLLRVVLPSEILSYSSGIFTKISHKMFLITLLIGAIPGSIFYAYLGSLSILYQLIWWAIGIIVLIIIFYFTFNIINKKA